MILSKRFSGVEWGFGVRLIYVVVVSVVMNMDEGVKFW